MAQATAPILDSTIAAFAALQKFGRYWTNNGQILILASDGHDANDP